MAMCGGLNSSSGGELKLYLSCTGSTVGIIQLRSIETVQSLEQKTIVLLTLLSCPLVVFVMNTFLVTNQNSLEELDVSTGIVWELSREKSFFL